MRRDFFLVSACVRYTIRPGVVNLTGGMLFKDTFIKDKISHIRFSSGG